MCPRSKLFDQYATQLKWDALKENDSQSNLCICFFSCGSFKAVKRKPGLCKKLKQHVTKPQGQTVFDF